jgi:uncharacterized DUF497 family protein
MLEFDWDEENLNHIAEHQVTSAEVEFALSNPTLEAGYQDWHEEERFAEIGATSAGRVLMIVTTWRGLKTRVVTAFDADVDFVEEYHRSR